MKQDGEASDVSELLATVEECASEESKGIALKADWTMAENAF